jgi:hypothetical protein
MGCTQRCHSLRFGIVVVAHYYLILSAVRGVIEREEKQRRKKNTLIDINKLKMQGEHIAR